MSSQPTAVELVPASPTLSLPALPGSTRRDQNPALVYLASLAPGSRRTMTEALSVIAGILTNDQAGIETLPWRELRYPHTMAVRAVLAERYSYATVNKMLSALRGTLKAAWRLEQMTAEEYQRAIDVPATNDPPGRGMPRFSPYYMAVACAALKLPSCRSPITTPPKVLSKSWVSATNNAWSRSSVARLPPSPPG
jgi:hypothetical protein